MKVSQEKKIVCKAFERNGEFGSKKQNQKHGFQAKQTEFKWLVKNEQQKGENMWEKLRNFCASLI